MPNNESKSNHQAIEKAKLKYCRRFDCCRRFKCCKLKGTHRNPVPEDGRRNSYCRKAVFWQFHVRDSQFHLIAWQGLTVDLRNRFKNIELPLEDVKIHGVARGPS